MKNTDLKFLAKGKIIIDYFEKEVFINGYELAEIMKEKGLDRKHVFLYYMVTPDEELCHKDHKLSVEEMVKYTTIEEYEIHNAG